MAWRWQILCAVGFQVSLAALLCGCAPSSRVAQWWATQPDFGEPPEVIQSEKGAKS